MNRLKVIGIIFLGAFGVLVLIIFFTNLKLYFDLEEYYSNNEIIYKQEFEGGIIEYYNTKQLLSFDYGGTITNKIADSLNQQAKELIKNQSNDKAIRLLIEADELEPNNTTILFNIGQSLMNLGNRTEAKKVLQQSIASSDTINKMAILTLGNIYLDEGEYDKSIAEYNKILGKFKSYSNNLIVLYHLVEVLVEKGNCDEAEKAKLTVDSIGLESGLYFMIDKTQMKLDKCY